MTRMARFTRTLRIQEDENLGQMAKNLGVSSAFLSRIENGLAKPSEKVISGLIEKYPLTQEQINELRDIADEARQNNILSTLKLDSEKQQLIYRFAKAVDSFTKEELDEINLKIDQRERSATK